MVPCGMTKADDEAVVTDVLLLEVRRQFDLGRVHAKKLPPVQMLGWVVLALIDELAIRHDDEELWNSLRDVAKTVARGRGHRGSS